MAWNALSATGCDTISTKPSCKDLSQKTSNDCAAVWGNCFAFHEARRISYADSFRPDQRARLSRIDRVSPSGAIVGWDKLINRSGTTWRGLPPNRKDPQSDAEYVLLVREYPSLVRRPVALIDGEVMVGFTGGLYEKRFLTTKVAT